jgi:hypothetical protein
MSFEDHYSFYYAGSKVVLLQRLQVAPPKVTNSLVLVTLLQELMRLRAI